VPEFDSNTGTGTARGSSFSGAHKISSSKAGAARELTKEEKYVLQDTIDEQRRKGCFKRIFPSVDFLYYKQFFDEHRPLNHLLDEKLMAKKRDMTHAARMMHEKMPIFLQTAGLTSARSATKSGAAPASGNLSLTV